MSKPAIPAFVPNCMTEKGTSKRKRRRPSAPDKTLSVGEPRKMESRLELKKGMIEEEVIVE